MMASKAALMGDRETLEKILKEKNPAKQKALGRLVKNFDQALWDEVRSEVVYYGNLWKFSQNLNLKKFLLGFPRNTIFAEAAPWDKIWGIGLGQHQSMHLSLISAKV